VGDRATGVVVERRVVVAAGLVLVVAAALLLLVDFQNFIDLRVYRAGGRAWLDGLSLYTDEFNRGTGVGLPFTYPPVSAIVFTIIAVVPFWAAIAVITLASLCALVAVAVIVVRRPRLAVLAAIAGGVLIEPVRLTLSYGQINLLLMGLVVADCLLPRTRWPRGLLIGVAAAVKLTPAAFVLYFVAHRQWRPAVTAVVGFTAATLVAWALAPHETTAYLSTVLGDPSRIGELPYTGNQSLNGFWHRFGLGGTLTTVLWFISALAVAALGWRAVARARAAGDDLAALVAAAAVGLLVSPVSWSHHWVWAAVAGMWLLPRMREWDWPGRIASAVGMLLFVVPPHWVLPNKHGRELDWTLWQHIVGNDFVWCALALLIVLARRAWTTPTREARSA